MKLCEMGILNPKGNLYSKVPLIPCQNKSANSSGVGRNPMSPLPEPPSNGSPSAEEDSSQSRAQFESKYPTFFSLQVNFQRFLLFF